MAGRKVRRVNRVSTSNSPVKSKKETNSSTQTASSPKLKQQTLHGRINYLKDSDRLKEIFSMTNNALQLLDLTKTESRTYTVYSKDKLRTYLKNPTSYQNNLRDLSKFLYRLCYNYRRIVNYYADMTDLTAYVAVPKIDFTSTPSADQVMKSYYQTLTKMEQMRLPQEMHKLLVTAWREDCVYAYAYDDDDTFFFHILDGEYCKVSSIDGGVLNFAFDFSYFRSHAIDLEYWDSEFQSKYNAYVNDSSLRWQELDPEKTICLKVNMDDEKLPYPPFASLFEAIIDLIDLQSIQSVKDELSIYKLLVARLKPLSGTNEPDDFEVDVNTAIQYYNKLAAVMPECVTSVISPLPIEAIDFKGSDTSDVDMITNATNNLFLNSGGAQVLNNPKTSATIAQAQMICDTEMAISSLLPQIQAWTNRYLTAKLGDDHAIIKFLEVSPYTKADKKKSLMESVNFGEPAKLAVAALDGFSPLEALSLQFLENDCLDLASKWIPPQSAYTQSGNLSSTSDETNEKDLGDLTDEGERSRDKQ